MCPLAQPKHVLPKESIGHECSMCSGEPDHLKAAQRPTEELRRWNVADFHLLSLAFCVPGVITVTLQCMLNAFQRRKQDSFSTSCASGTGIFLQARHLRNLHKMYTRELCNFFAMTYCIQALFDGSLTKCC